MLRKALRRGDMIEVRSAKEILVTLDKEGRLDALPFMPEMLQYCGRRFVVDKRAEKVCDTIKHYSSRRMQATLILEDRRCDGSGHDGCQADCRLFWKEAWVRRVFPDEHPSATEAGNGASRDLEELTARYANRIQEVDGRPVTIYRCQATDLYEASRPLRAFDPRPYVREFTNGNVAIGRFLRVTARAYAENLLAKLRHVVIRRMLGRNDYTWVHLPGNRVGPASDNLLGLQPGDLVQVKTREEIAATLTPRGKERGLWFDREMVPFCGGTYRVRQRVKRFIDDRTGRMIELKRDCVTLEGVVCSGDRSDYRHFCPRAIYPFWRESWLRRITPQGASGPENSERQMVGSKTNSA